MKTTKNKVKYYNLSDLSPLKRNPRIIFEDDLQRLMESIKNNPDYLEARPLILSNRTGKRVILAGNQRYKAAERLNLKEIPAVIIEGLTEEKEKELIIRDNVSNGRWDMDLLADTYELQTLEDLGLELNLEQVDIGIEEFFSEEEPRRLEQIDTDYIECPSCHHRQEIVR